MHDTLVRVLSRTCSSAPRLHDSRVRRLGRQRTAQGRLSAFVRLDARGRRPPSAAVEDVPGMGALRLLRLPRRRFSSQQTSGSKREKEHPPPSPAQGVTGQRFV